jgi:hypothetical protein
MRPSTSISCALLAGAALSLAAGGALGQTAHVPLDHETTVDGIGVGCTGIGQTKDAPKWNDYSVKIEFADSQRNLLADETMTLSRGGESILTVKCAGPWILLKLPPGKAYQISGSVPGTSASAGMTVTAPSQGQGVFALTFPVGQ